MIALLPASRFHPCPSVRAFLLAVRAPPDRVCFGGGWIYAVVIFVCWLTGLLDSDSHSDLKPLVSSTRRLEQLTLHGNPLEATRELPSVVAASMPVFGYRHKVLRMLPWLKQLDFASFTKKEKDDVCDARLRRAGRQRRSQHLQRSGCGRGEETDRAGAMSICGMVTEKVTTTMLRDRAQRARR